MLRSLSCGSVDDHDYNVPRLVARVPMMMIIFMDTASISTGITSAG